MVTDDKISMIARLARTLPSNAEGKQTARIDDRSVLMLAAASYGSRPMDESTIPTGFNPQAAALFESIVEAAFVVATADGVFDEEEQRVFEKVVTAACGGSISQSHVKDLVADLADQLHEDGLDLRIQRISQFAGRREHAQEVIRIAALIAQCSEEVSEAERAVLEKIAVACRLDVSVVDAALRDAALAAH